MIKHADRLGNEPHEVVIFGDGNEPAGLERATQMVTEMNSVTGLAEWQEDAVIGLGERARAEMRGAAEEWFSIALHAVSSDLRRGRESLAEVRMPEDWETILIADEANSFTNHVLVDTASGWLGMAPDVRAVWPSLTPVLIRACGRYERSARIAWFLNSVALWHLLAGALRGMRSDERPAVTADVSTWPDWAGVASVGTWKRTCGPAMTRTGFEITENIAINAASLRILAARSLRTTDAGGRALRRELRDVATGLYDSVVDAAKGTPRASWVAWPYPDIRPSYHRGDIRISDEVHPATALALTAYEAIRKLKGVRSRTDLLQPAIAAEQCAGATLAMVRAAARHMRPAE